jgi:predicted aminopeptidase
MRLWLALLASLLAGCSHVAYYAQAIHGQATINTRAVPIDAVLADAATNPRLANKLQLVQQARAFASDALGLPANGSYRSYVDLQRRFAVWNVFAAPAFSVTPIEWCFPIAGCVAYRGYFSEAAAQEAGAQLRAEGLDVFVAGIPAYSTLGWFDDPVMNTFIHYPEPELVGLMFHELAHQLVYLPGDSTFNESFATAVEQEGVRRWYERAHDPQGYAAYQAAQARKQAFTALLVRTRDQLAAAYAKEASVDQRAADKARIVAQAGQAYAALKQSWGGYAGYDPWFTDTPLSNAKLISATLYADRVPAFSALLAQLGGDLPRFYARVRGLAQLPAAERELQLAALLPPRLSAARF